MNESAAQVPQAAQVAAQRFDLPDIDAFTAPYWQAAAEGRLLLRRCRAQGCRVAHHYPREFCPRCWSEDVGWEEASGHAVLYTWSVVHRNDLPPFGTRVSYVAAVVELAEGPRMITRVTDCPPEELRVGMELRVAFQAVGGAEDRGGAQEPASRSSGLPGNSRWRGRSGVSHAGPVRIRVATEADWQSIWPFFRRIVAAGETYTYPRDIAEPLARETWMLQPPGRTVVAVDEDGAVLGSAKMNPNHMGGSSHIAGASFMVDPDGGGKGVGRALGEHVLEWAKREGYRAMQFNAVVETNTRAVGLWKSLGFEIVATLEEGFLHPEHGYVGLHIMYQRFEDPSRRPQRGHGRA